GDTGKVIRHTIDTYDEEDLPFVESGQDAGGNVSLIWIPNGSSCACGDPNTLYATRLDGNGAPLPQPLTVADYSAEDLHFTSASYAVRADGHAVVAATV